MLQEFIEAGVFNALLSGTLTDKEAIAVLKLARLQTDIPGLFNRYIQPEGDEDMSLDKVILYKDVEQVIPQEVITVACNTYNKYVGAAVAVDGEINILRNPSPAVVNEVM